MLLFNYDYKECLVPGKLLSALILVSALPTAHAFDEFGNVKFNMTRKQVESKGYVCTTSPIDAAEIMCRNFDLRSRAYGYAAANFSVHIGADKKLYQISAEIQGIKGTEDFFDLAQKVSFLFPLEDEANSHGVQGAFVRYARRDAKNASALLVMAAGVPGIKAMSFTISYTAPERILAQDKQRKLTELNGKGSGSVEPPKSEN